MSRTSKRTGACSLSRRLDVANRRKWTAAAVAVTVLLAAGTARSEETPAAGWSADLLQQIVRAETRPPSPAVAHETPQEMVLQTYQLRHLRVGEAGKAQNILAILDKLLPPGSSVNSDVPANSLHVLTTPAAHKAAWDYLTSVDIENVTLQAEAGGVPQDVKDALTTLAHAGESSERVLAAVGQLKADVAGEFAAIEERQRRRTVRAVSAAACGLVVLVLGTAWHIRRRTAPPSQERGVEALLAPDQVATALTPVHDRLRTDMLGLLNEVAIKLQAQHNDQQKVVREQHQQLEEARLALVEERRQFIAQTGTMVVEAVERVDATTSRLARQQDKVAELVQELQNTVRELDHTKDTLRDKEVELEQERSKIAALSILLEEGGSLSGTAHGQNGHAAFPCQAVPSPVSPSGPRHSPSSCTRQDQETPQMPHARNSGQNGLNPGPQFTFLPPDHPES